MVYREVLFTEYLPDECFLIIGTYTWNLKEGIITLLDSIEGNKELVVTYLSSDKLIAKVRLDIENDGSFLVFTATAEKFTAPPESNDYHLIVLRNNNVNDKVQLIWDVYNGYNEFKKSEIFRSLDGVKSNAELIETITDINENSFNDLEIPKTSKLSYFIKIVTNEGVIESELNPTIIADYTFEVALVTLEDPVVKDDAIELSWSKFEGASGSEYQEIPLVILEDINTINF